MSAMLQVWKCWFAHQYIDFPKEDADVSSENWCVSGPVVPAIAPCQALAYLPCHFSEDCLTPEWLTPWNFWWLNPRSRIKILAYALPVNRHAPVHGWDRSVGLHWGAPYTIEITLTLILNLVKMQQQQNQRQIFLMNVFANIFNNIIANQKQVL